MYQPRKSKQKSQTVMDKLENKLLNYLVAHPNATLDEIVKETAMPRAETLVRLNDLEHEGLVCSDWGTECQSPQKNGKRYSVRRFSLKKRN